MSMKELSTEIEILSTQHEVWRKITDLPNWASWNPIVNSLIGKVELGTKIKFVMSDAKGNNGKKYDAIISSINDKRGFTYVAVMMNKYMFKAERIIEISPTEKGVLFKQTEKYTGMLSGLFWEKMKEGALPMIESMNRALKQELEN